MFIIGGGILRAKLRKIFMRGAIIGGILLILAILVLGYAYLRINVHYQKHKDEYKDKIPVFGIQEQYVPQGLAYDPIHNYSLQTSYSANGHSSILYIVDFQSGNLVKAVHLKNQDQTNSDHHVGGVATDGKTIWISSDYIVSVFDIEEILHTDKNSVASKSDYEIPIRGDFCTYHDGRLWIGDFYLKNFYDVPNDNPLLMGYIVDEAINFAKPEVVLSIPSMVQGLTFNEDNQFVFTRSFTYLNRTIMDVYDNVLNQKSSQTIKVESKKIPYYRFGKDNLNKEIMLPPMGEGLFYLNGAYYILFESGSNHYSLAYPKMKYITEYKIK